MKQLKIVHIGAGSGFVLAIARELLSHEMFDNAEFCLTDPAPDRLKSAYEAVTDLNDTVRGTGGFGSTGK